MNIHDITRLIVLLADKKHCAGVFLGSAFVHDNRMLAERAFYCSNGKKASCPNRHL